MSFAIRVVFLMKVRRNGKLYKFSINYNFQEISIMILQRQLENCMQYMYKIITHKHLHQLCQLGAGVGT